MRIFQRTAIPGGSHRRFRCNDTQAAGGRHASVLHNFSGLLCIALLLSACSTPPARSDKTLAPSASTDAVRVERVDREFALDKSIHKIDIINRYGEINIKRHDEAEVGVHAVIQRLPPDFAKVTIESRRENGVLHITTNVPDDKSGRIDIAVFVSKSIALVLTTEDSRISVKQWHAPIQATSKAGEIRASSLQRLDLHTDSGQIRAIAIGRRWSGETRITTDSGRIILLVPTFGDIALDARTGGKLISKFGLSVHDREGLHVAQAHYGSGTSPLIVRSRSGEIVLEQLVLLEEDSDRPVDDD